MWKLARTFLLIRLFSGLLEIVGILGRKVKIDRWKPQILAKLKVVLYER